MKKKNKNLLCEGIVDSFVQNPFSFMFGAHFLQSLMREPEQGEDPEFEEWLDAQDELPDAVETMMQNLQGRKMKPDEIRARGIDFLGREEIEAMRKAMEELPPELQSQFDDAMSEKAAKAYNGFQDSAKAALKVAEDNFIEVAKALDEIAANAERDGAGELFSKAEADQIKQRMEKELLIYQKSIIQKIATFEEALQDILSKTKNEKLASKLNLGGFSIDEVLKEEDAPAAKQARSVISDVSSWLEDLSKDTDTQLSQFVKSVESLENYLGTGILLPDKIAALRWARTMKQLAKKWNSDTNDFAVEIKKELEAMMKKKISSSKAQQDKKVNESFSRESKKFYESLGDFS